MTLRCDSYNKRVKVQTVLSTTKIATDSEGGYETIPQIKKHKTCGRCEDVSILNSDNRESICCMCGSNKSVKYINTKTRKRYCNRCIVIDYINKREE